MKLTTGPAAPASLEEVRALFEHWRQNRKRKTSIPETLWEAAASLYPSYSLHPISGTLSINHTKLKHYARPEPTAQTPAAAEDFIKLEPAVCRQKLREDPFAGHVFVFRNKRAMPSDHSCMTARGFGCAGNGCSRDGLAGGRTKPAGP